MTEEKWALEWSHKQNCFHIQKLEHSLASTQQCLIENRVPLYSIIMVGEKEACHTMANNHRHRLREREVLVTLADCI